MENNEEKNFDFAGIIAEHLSNPHEMVQFASKVMKNAEEGDSASLKMIQQALEDVKFQKDKKQILSDEQLRRIIQLTYERDLAQG